MTDQRVNVPLLRKAVEWAEAEALKPPELREWEQGEQVTTAEELRQRGWNKAPECGTCFCIGGFVAATVDARYATEEVVDGVSACDFAAIALGLPMTGSESINDHHNGLFSGGNNIADVRRIAESLAGERL